MKQNKIMLFFAISLVFSTIMRYIQINYTVDFTTGFFKIGFKKIGYFILIAIIAVAILSAFFGGTAIRRPKGSPKKNIPLSIASFFCAVTIGYQVFGPQTILIISPILSVLFKLTGLAAFGFFLAYGIGGFVDFKIPPICSVIPCVYVIIRIICDFTGIASLALISDNILLIIAYCMILLFMLNFAKLYNNTDQNTNFRKISATGIGASVLSVSQAVPYFITNIIKDGQYNHVSPSENLSILSFGVFITVFLLSHFSKENAE